MLFFILEDVAKRYSEEYRAARYLKVRDQYAEDPEYPFAKEEKDDADQKGRYYRLRQDLVLVALREVFGEADVKRKHPYRVHRDEYGYKGEKKFLHPVRPPNFDFTIKSLFDKRTCLDIQIYRMLKGLTGFMGIL